MDLLALQSLGLLPSDGGSRPIPPSHLPAPSEVLLILQSHLKSKTTPTASSLNTLLALHLLARIPPPGAAPLPSLTLERVHLQLCATLLGNGGGVAVQGVPSTPPPPPVLPALAVFFASLTHSQGKCKEGALRDLCASAYRAINGGSGGGGGSGV
jgi:hypothetical protein